MQFWGGKGGWEKRSQDNGPRNHSYRKNQKKKKNKDCDSMPYKGKFNQMKKKKLTLQMDKSGC